LGGIRKGFEQKVKRTFLFEDLMNLTPGVLRDVNGDLRGIQR
jgi:hypothetical protein